MKRLKSVVLSLIIFFLFSSISHSQCELSVDGNCYLPADIIEWNGLGNPPATSISGVAIQYFDQVLGKLQCSEDGEDFRHCLPDNLETVQTGLDGTTTIPLTSLYIKLESNGGDVSANGNPRIAAGRTSGDILILEGTSDVNKLIFANGNGLSMSASVTLGDKDILAFIWNNTLNEWIMLFSDTK